MQKGDNMSEQNIPRQRRIHRLELDQYDDVISIKDRLQFVTAGRVLLIFPPEKKILQRKLDLVLIQREAARLDLWMAIVSQDFTVIDHATELDISVFPSSDAARRKSWKKPKNKVFISRDDRPHPYSPHDQYELMRKATRLKTPPSPRQRQFSRLFRGSIFGIAILVVLIGFYATLPSATVIIYPARDQLNVTIPMIADPTIDSVIPEGRRVPATVERRIQESSVSLQTTGRRPAANALAEGIVTFRNETNLAIFVPAGTIVQTSTVPPARFETQEDAALAAEIGATTNVAIRALDTNDPFTSNQPPGAIDRVFGELEGSITVTNRNATYGEGVREIAYVTQADHDRLLELARDQIRSDALSTLRVSLAEGEFLIVDQSIEIISEREERYSAEINQPAERVSLTLQAVIEATIINLGDARIVALSNLGQYITEGRDQISVNSLVFRSGGVQNVLDNGSITFQMRVEGDLYVSIDPDQVRERLTGSTVREALDIINNEYLLDPERPPQIDTWPGFFNRMPILSIRIQVEIKNER